MLLSLSCAPLQPSPSNCRSATVQQTSFDAKKNLKGLRPLPLFNRSGIFLRDECIIMAYYVALDIAVAPYMGTCTLYRSINEHKHPLYYASSEFHPKISIRNISKLITSTSSLKCEIQRKLVATTMRQTATYIIRFEHVNCECSYVVFLFLFYYNNSNAVV